MECDDKNNNIKVSFHSKLLLYDMNINFLKSILSPLYDEYFIVVSCYYKWRVFIFKKEWTLVYNLAYI